MRTRIQELAIVGAILLAALLLRLPYLQERSFWLDEAATWKTASFKTPAMIESLKVNVHLPLFYFFVKGWMGAFGDSPASLRGFSIFLGIATVGATYILAKEIGRSLLAGWEEKSGFAYFAAALVAVAPFQVHASVEARMYTLGTFAAVCSALFLLRGLRIQTTREWAGFVISCTVMMHSHHFGVFSAVGFFLFSLGCVAFGVRLGNERIPVSLSTLAGVWILIALLYQPVLFLTLEQVSRTHGNFWVPPLSPQEIGRTIHRLFVAVDGGLAPAWQYLSLSVVGLSSFILVARPTPAGLLCLLSFAVPLLLAAVVSFVIDPIWVDRYFRIAQVFLLLTIAIACYEAFKGTYPHHAATAMVCFVGVLGLLNLHFWSSLAVPEKPGMRGVVSHIQKETNKESLVVVVDPLDFVTADYYLRETPHRLRLLAPEDEGPVPAGHYIGRDRFIHVEELNKLSAYWVIRQTTSEMHRESGRRVGTKAFECPTSFNSPLVVEQVVQNEGFTGLAR